MPSQPNCHSSKHAKKSFVAAAGQYCFATVDSAPTNETPFQKYNFIVKIWKGPEQL
jgi:hypothetical protein